MRRTRCARLIAALAAVVAPTTAQAGPTVTTAIAEFRVNVGGGVVEHYRVRLTEPDDIETARGIRSGSLPSMIPSGWIVRGATDVNKGYTWHIDPKRFVFTPYAFSECNVRPSAVEHLPNLGRLCPWSAELKELWLLPGR